MNLSICINLTVVSRKLTAESLTYEVNLILGVCGWEFMWLRHSMNSSSLLSWVQNIDISSMNRSQSNGLLDHF